MLCAPQDLEDRVPHDSVPYDLEETAHMVQTRKRGRQQEPNSKQPGICQKCKEVNKEKEIEENKHEKAIERQPRIVKIKVNNFFTIKLRNAQKQGQGKEFYCWKE